LWPGVAFSFINEIADNINQFDAIFFGGGDLFDQKIPNVNKIKIPIGLIGVGYHSIHPVNKVLFDTAKVIITRNESPWHVAEDLVFSLPEQPIPKTDSKIITVLVNDFLTPRTNGTDYIRNAHQSFTSEMANILDDLIINKNCSVRFVPMCINPTIDDRKYAAAIISKMDMRYKTEWILEPVKTLAEFSEILTSSHTVITQRLHGSIFSYIYGVPQISINHHDKMKSFCKKIDLESQINYYGFNKELFFNFFEKSYYKESRETYLSIARQQWQDYSHIVAQKFFL
jgi:hypothetical protein